MLKDNIDSVDYMLTFAALLALADAPARMMPTGSKGCLAQASPALSASSPRATADPMARNLADAAAVHSVIADTDSRDPVSTEADRHTTDDTRLLDPNDLSGKRIGLFRQFAGNPSLTVPASLAHGLLAGTVFWAQNGVSLR